MHLTHPIHAVDVGGVAVEADIDWSRLSLFFPSHCVRRPAFGRKTHSTVQFHVAPDFPRQITRHHLIHCAERKGVGVGVGKGGGRREGVGKKGGRREGVGMGVGKKGRRRKDGGGRKRKRGGVGKKGGRR